MNLDRETQQLLDDFFSGEATAEHVALVEAWLLKDPAHAEVLMEYGLIDRLLCREQRRLDASAIFEILRESEEAADSILVDLSARSGPVEDLSRREPVTLRDLRMVVGYLVYKGLSRRRVLLGVAASVLVAGILLAAVLLSGPEPVEQLVQVPAAGGVNEVVVATLTASRDAQWSSSNYEVGDLLLSGTRMSLVSGYAEVTTLEGAVAVLEGPVTVEWLDKNALRLHSGRLVGVCETPSSRGFLVRTPHMDVIDLGTRFGVEVSPGLGSEVHVHQGEVRVDVPLLDGSSGFRPQRIVSDEAVRIDAVTRRVEMIEPVFEKFSTALATVLLPGTGVGLPEGTVVGNWQVIEDANGPLEVSPPLIVQRSKSEQYPHFDVKGNDPSRAQWLFFGGGNSAYYPFDPIPGLKPERLLIEGRVDLPESVDLSGKVLYVRYGCSEELHSLKINGRGVELPRFIAGPNRPLFYEVELPVDQTGLRPGSNVVLVDVDNRINSSMASFYLYWELRPAGALSPGTGGFVP